LFYGRRPFKWVFARDAAFFSYTAAFGGMPDQILR
jgi:hypothetical protein